MWIFWLEKSGAEFAKGHYLRIRFPFYRDPIVCNKIAVVMSAGMLLMCVLGFVLMTMDFFHGHLGIPSMLTLVIPMLLIYPWAWFEGRASKFRSKVEGLAKRLGMSVKTISQLSEEGLRFHCRCHLYSLARSVVELEGVNSESERCQNARNMFREHYRYFSDLNLISGGYGQFFPSR